MDSIASAATVAIAVKKLKEGGQRQQEKKQMQVATLEVPFKPKGGGKSVKTRKIKIQPRLTKVASDCSTWLGLSDMQRSFEELHEKQVYLREQVVNVLLNVIFTVLLLPPAPPCAEHHDKHIHPTSNININLCGWVPVCKCISAILAKLTHIWIQGCTGRGGDYEETGSRCCRLTNR